MPLAPSSLRSNLRTTGLIDLGQPYQGTYAAVVTDGRVDAVVAHYWNGILVFQAPHSGAELARLAASRSGRAVRGLIGPWAQIQAARGALGLERAASSDPHAGMEDLFALELDALVVPAPLSQGRLRCRLAEPSELDFLTDWRVEYRVTLLGETPGPELHRDSRAQLGRSQAAGDMFVLVQTEDGAPLATSSFNARIPDCVQVGGVFTPVEQRGRGYARAAVAGSLLAARQQGVTSAVLFTGADNLAAQAAYLALGFRKVGSYGMVLFQDGP